MNSNETTNEQKPRRCRHGGRKRWVKVPFIIVAVVLIKSAIVMFLWNDLATELFHLPVVSFLQAIEITILAKMLFGFGGRGMMGRFGRHRFGHRLAHMSPEEREKFKSEFKRGFGHER